MVEQNHPFAELVLGTIIHVTGVEGYRGIRKDRLIRPNLGDLKPTWASNVPVYYYCQKRAAVSVLDLKHADRSSLFKRASHGVNFQNWLGVFTYHTPSIALCLNLGAREQNLFRCSSTEELLEDGTKHIFEAEACFPDPIPYAFISNIIVVEGSIDKFRNTRKTELTDCDLHELERSSKEFQKSDSFYDEGLSL